MNIAIKTTALVLSALSIWSVTTAARNELALSGVVCFGSNRLEIEGSSESTQKTRIGWQATRPLSVLPVHSQSGYTTSGHPTIFVYVPETEDYKKVFFGMQDEQFNQHYDTRFEISGERGIVAIALPEELPPLEKGKVYRWHLTVYDDFPTPNHPRTSGEIRRMDLPVHTQHSAQQLANSGFWYDALGALWPAKKTGDLEVEDNWRSVLTSLGLKDFINKLATIELLSQPIAD